MSADISRLDAEIKRLDQLRDADQRAVEAALTAAKDAVAAALIASEKAVNKAEEAQLRVNETQNEFRGQLKDQASTFPRREELEELRRLIATEREERRANEGIKRGMGQTTGIIVGAIAFVGAALGIVVILINILTGAP